MRSAVLSFMLAAGACVALSAQPADFPQWRGPLRNGVVPGAPPLADSWPEGGPPKVWESEEVPSGGNGGSGSVAVAGGRAFVFANEKYKVPLTTRTLGEKDLRELGWQDVKLPEELARAVEAARCGQERAKVERSQLDDWVRKWVADRLKTEEERKLYGRYLSDRLHRGPKALHLDVLAKLEAIKDRELPDAEALDKWLTEQKIEGDDRKAILRAVPVDVEKAWDTVYCFDAADGRTVWKWRVDGRPDGHGASGTPCIAGGRVYLAGSNGLVYCLDAAKGAELWRTQAAERPEVVHSSVLAAGDAVVVLAGRLIALEAETGSIRWRQEKVGGDMSSPVAWRAGGRTSILCSAGRGVGCVDLETGKLLWEAAPGASRSTVAVDGDLLAVFTGRKDAGLAIYRLSGEKAEKLSSAAENPEGDSSSILHEGHAYFLPRGAAVCVEAATGKLAWSQRIDSRGCSSPVLADGKLFFPAGKWLYMARATPAAWQELGKAALPISEHTSPAIVAGRLYLRLKKSVGCYDLRRPPATSAAASARAAP